MGIQSLLLRLAREEDAQAALEYMLMAMVAVSVIGVVGYGFRSIVLYVWQVISCQVSAGCPTCPPDPAIKNRLYPGACH